MNHSAPRPKISLASKGCFGCLGVLVLAAIAANIGDALTPDSPPAAEPAFNLGEKKPRSTTRPIKTIKAQPTRLAKVNKAPQKARQGRSQRLQKYLADFEGTDWFGVQKGASVEGGTAKLVLDLPRNEIWRPTIENACGALTGYINSSDNASQRLTRIQIKNVQNELLAWTGIDGSCSTFSAF